MYHNIVFLQGILFNELKDTTNENKLLKIKHDILKYFKKNKDNYFVNETGFQKLLTEIIQNKPNF